MIGDVLWEPTSARWADTNLRRFGDWLAAERGVEADGYAALHRWSIDEPEEFWRAIWDFDGIQSPDYVGAVLASADVR